MPLTIHPYLMPASCWVFDDQRTGLKEEAFVLGMREMISRVVEVKKLPFASSGFELVFDAAPFDHDVELNWIPANSTSQSVAEHCAGGNWYEADVFGHSMTGWLCPALLLYFPIA